MEFTKDQQRVIDVRKRNILVSAAAGSGKTAVLVERIINMILDEENPVDIDRLLVVTFTEAAALEMRERIGKAVQDRLDRDPLNEHLQKQSALLYKAQISTIHSFCLNVIRNNFNEIGLDPAFRVGDTTELKLMEEDVLETLFEELYEQKNEDFLKLVNYFSKGVTDDRLREALLELCHFAEGYPWPEEWLNSCLMPYKASEEDFDALPWVRYILSYIRSRIEDVKPMIKAAEEFLDNPLAPLCYQEVPKKDMEFIDSLLNSDSYDKLREMLDVGFIKLPTAPKDSDKEFKEEFKAKRDAYKKVITDTTKSTGVKSMLQFASGEEMASVYKIAPVAESLVKLAIDFIRRFDEERIKKGVISFSDMEHYALNILYTTDDEGRHVPSKVAMEYRDAFDEILMDEYQDCNRVQEEIMMAVCDEKTVKNERFMVGDVKQSIYKFRLANPQLFIEKYNCYKTVDQIGQDTEACEKIVLHKNFRSRKNVINTVNNLFSQIMNEDFGGVEYDKMAALVQGADYPDYPDDKLVEKSSTDFLLLTLDNESNLNKFEQEAHLVASKIKELVSGFWVTDKETRELRPAQYKDIVILLRSMTQVAPAFKEVLQKEGIPVYVSLDVGFFDTNEIQDIIQYLKVIDNPRQDIPLYGSMHSFFGDFSDEELAEIRIKRKEEKDVCLFDSLCALKDENPKIAKFLNLLNEYRKKSRYMPIHSLIEDIISESGYLEYETALPGGSQRRANLLLLVSKAASFEGTSYKGLFHFLRYIGRMKKVESDEGEADVLGQNDDVVRIMTIHKSKGLEFPVCFLCTVEKQFNMMDIRNDVTVDMDLGIGMNLIDISRRVKKTPLIRKGINLKIKQDILGEELRVLYVALTRAKEKLLITGVIENEEEFLEKRELVVKTVENSGRMPFGMLSEAKNYLDFLMPISNEAQILTWEDLRSLAFEKTIEETAQKGKLLLEARSLSPEDEDYLGLKERTLREYSHPELEGMILKTSVSELKKQYLDLEFTEELFPETDSKEMKTYEPVFACKQEREISGTQRGNAYHKVMELLDFSDRDIKSQINKFVEKQLLLKEYADAVSVTKIEKFLDSELAQRMAIAQQNGRLKKEQPFVLGIEANRVKPHYSKDETVLLQGIIDAFFIEENEIILVDYKTDAIKSADELRKRYSVQVDYYKEALEKILGMKVKETILYSFSLMEEVHV